MLIATLLLVELISALSQAASPVRKPTDTWLHPGDFAYRAAIQDGFSGKAAVGPYNEDKGGIHQLWFNFTTSRSKDNVIVLFSPLRCAELLGLNSRHKLLDSPAIEDARNTCDGNLFAAVTYSTRQEASSFPLVLQHQDVTVRPPSVDFTDIPRINSHWNGSSYDNTYTYAAVFHLNLPEPWTNDVNLRYVVPEDGNPVDLKIDFSVFANDEALYERFSGK